MCTVSFMPTGSGFHLLMNRDEQRNRPEALPPRLHSCGNHKGLYPSETGGGTWIGINDSGITAALINWYSMPRPSRVAFSRGLIIPTLLSAGSIPEAESLLKSLPLGLLAPFRLLVIDGPSRNVTGFSMAGGVLQGMPLPWNTFHWFSSGHDEQGAQRTRGDICSVALGENDAGSLPWLRRIHASHDPEPGPYSVCMHREDAATVSFTEVTLDDRVASMVYREGPPCEAVNSRRLTLGLRRP